MTLHREAPTPDPVVVPAEEQHLEAARELWLDRFGGDEDIVDGWLEDSLAGDRPEELFVALDGGNVIGMGIVTRCEPDYAREYVGLDAPAFEPWDSTGILNISAVAEDRTGEGIGSKLFEKRLRYLSADGAEGVFGMSWHRDDHPDSRPLFEKYGFECLHTFERYYARSHGRTDCPDCVGECGCTVSLYARDLT